MSEPASISTGIAARYATAVFDLAHEDDRITDLESDLSTLETALDDSADFRNLINSPVYTRDQQSNAIAPLADKMGLSDILSNTLKLMASKRRLFVLPHMVSELRARIAADRGEIIADVTSAKALTKAQTEKLAETLKANMGQAVNIKASVDESLIGGLVVKVGSKMIDTSIRSKLSSLQNVMKEAG